METCKKNRKKSKIFKEKKSENNPKYIFEKKKFNLPCELHPW